MCKMGGGSVADWVPRNEEERWHGCGLVSGLIKRINQTTGLLSVRRTKLGGELEMLGGAGLVLFAFWTSRERKKKQLWGVLLEHDPRNRRRLWPFRARFSGESRTIGRNETKPRAERTLQSSTKPTVNRTLRTPGTGMSAHHLARGGDGTSFLSSGRFCSTESADARLFTKPIRWGRGWDRENPLARPLHPLLTLIDDSSHPTSPFDETVGLRIPFPGVLEPNHPDSFILRYQRVHPPPGPPGSAEIGPLGERRRGGG